MEQLEKIEELRAKISAMKSEKERLSGKIEATKTRIKQLEDECKAKFGITADKLEEKKQQLENEITSLVKKINNLLGENN